MPTPHYGQPRYRVIADKLRANIEAGLIPPGALLPPESTLSADYRASRGTIRQAIAALRQAGLVVTEHGRGTYARPRPLEQTRPADTTEPETRQRQIPAEADLAMLFEVRVGAALIEQETVMRNDGGVVRAVVRTYRLAD
ncbi:GntR family transcriptional regulator [Micromonospora sp. M61]|uniref:GntR family transcriptional regulator n=1 Tax=Micromonospora sp. M61 TaxID=2824890 RepID=UPI001B359C74|nr:GntR family transcriptional regulator [Micromonospora sp. M61]MBQ0977565.1 GntR family transcriptional regulator [Micromonospora sp. M61]